MGLDYLLSKLLPPLVYPLGLCLLLLAATLVATALGRRRLALLGGSAAAAVLWLAATPWCAASLAHSLQRGYEEVPTQEVPEADAILVIGGIMGPARTLEGSNLSGAVDRLLHAKRLFQAGRAPLVIVAGGAGDGWLPEADLMAGLLLEWGVPGSAILRETRSRNTRQNALEVAPLLAQQGLGRVLLVTSAIHMRRAQETFRAAGIKVLPAPTDFFGAPTEPSLLEWFPDAGALELTSRCLKEYLGLGVYRWRGWAVP